MSHSPALTMSMAPTAALAQPRLERVERLELALLTTSAKWRIGLLSLVTFAALC